MTGRAIEAALAELGVTDTALSAGARAALDDEGYVVLRAVYPPAQCAALTALFERRYLPSDQWPAPRGFDTRHAMLNGEEEAQWACAAPAILAAAHHVLRRRFYLSDVQGRDPKPGGGAQELHRDWLVPQARAPMVIALAFLDAFGPANGATRVVPRSHRLGADDDLGATLAEHPRQTVIEGQGGDVLVMDGYLLHGGMRNGSGAPRRNLQIDFRGHEMHARHVETRDLARLPPALRYLLGQDD